MWPRLLLGEDWASGEPIVCPLLEGGPRARRRFSGVGFPCPRLGSGEARSCPLNGPILDLIAPIRPLQFCADGGYQLRFRGLEGTPNYGPRQIIIPVLIPMVAGKLIRDNFMLLKTQFLPVLGGT
jgi:hypothetical protein